MKIKWNKIYKKKKPPCVHLSYDPWQVEEHHSWMGVRAVAASEGPLPTPNPLPLPSAIFVSIENDPLKMVHTGLPKWLN